MIFVTRILMVVLVLAVFPAQAQAPEQPATPPAADVAAAPVDSTSAQPPAETPPATTSASQSLVDAALDRMSLMFTEEEIEAVKSGKTKALPEDVAPVDETTQEVVEPEFDPANPPPPIPLNRKIALGGILYRAEGDWIIWLNGQKLGPDNLLPEIQGITVASDKVYLEWFDIGINGIIRLTLRPHQTYDIVTGLLLPGRAG